MYVIRQVMKQLLAVKNIQVNGFTKSKLTVEQSDDPFYVCLTEQVNFS